MLCHTKKYIDKFHVNHFAIDLRESNWHQNKEWHGENSSTYLFFKNELLDLLLFPLVHRRKKLRPFITCHLDGYSWNCPHSWIYHEMKYDIGKSRFLKRDDKIWIISVSYNMFHEWLQVIFLSVFIANIWSEKFILSLLSIKHT